MLDPRNALAQVEATPNRGNHEDETADQCENTSDDQPLRKHESLHVSTPGTEGGRGRREINCGRCQD